MVHCILEWYWTNGFSIFMWKDPLNSYNLTWFKMLKENFAFCGCIKATEDMHQQKCNSWAGNKRGLTKSEGTTLGISENGGTDYTSSF